MEPTLKQLIEALREAARQDAAGLLTEEDYAMLVLEAIVKYTAS